MVSRHWRGFRNRLARMGVVSHRSTFSNSVLGVGKADVFGVSPPHGQDKGSESWSIHPVLEALERGEPLGFAHYNHGECRCILYGKHRTRDDMDMCTKGVRDLLSASLDTLARTPDDRVVKRFLVGLPCPRCHGPKGADLLKTFPGLERLHRVPAMLFHHSMSWSRQRLGSAIRSRGGRAFLVCGSEHDTDAVASTLGLSFDGVLSVDRYAAYRDAGHFTKWLTEIDWEGNSRSSSLLFCCGAVGRSWAVEAFVSRPDSVTLCLGSYFDDVALGRTLHYAQPGKLVCRRCHRVRS